MEAAGNDEILAVKGLTKSFGELKAVDDLSFSVRRGEVFAFLGPNGAGKTTAINMICGLLECNAGDILMDGRSVKKDGRDYRNHIGLCPQDIVIWESLTCLEQLTIIGQLYDLGEREARDRALQLLGRLGLADKKHALARTLSGGMTRRLNIALALVHRPALLILDEPQAGLDPQSRVLVREYIRSLAAETTVILTTHDMDEADRLADRVAIIDHGKLLVLDTPDNLKNHVGDGDIIEIRASGDVTRVDELQRRLPGNVRNVSFHDGTLRIVGTDLPEILPRLMESLRQHNIAIEDMTLRKKSLEDVFILLTGRRLRE
ncbi:MAG: ATP-binding cassette domain-containing protein [Betaproteobacteria bacterium]